LKRVIRLVQGQRMTRYALMRDVLKHNFEKTSEES
jgi:hypothetical protein